MEQKIVDFIFRFRWLLCVSSILMMLVCAWGLSTLVIDGSPRAFMDDDFKGMDELTMIETNFGRTNNAVILLAPSKELEGQVENYVFDREQIKALKALSDASFQLPFSVRVESIITHQHSWSEGDDLYVESLFEDIDSLSDEDLQRTSDILLNEMVVLDRLLSSDGNYAAVVIEFAIEEGDAASVDVVGEAVYKLTAELEERFPNADIYPSGTLVNNFVTMKLALTDTSKVVSVMYVAMFVLLAVMLRSFTAMGIIVFISALSAMAGMGLGSWLNIAFTSLSMFSGSIIITVAIAHCVHLFIAFLNEYRNGVEKEQALAHCLAINLQPVFLTSFTTAVGFLSMNLSDLPPIRSIGNVSAGGVVIAFILSYAAFPALVSALPFSRKQSKSVLTNLMAPVADWVLKYSRFLLVGVLASALLLSYLGTKNVINDRMAEAIDMPHRIRIDNDKVDDHLGGIFNIQFQFFAKPGGSITDYEYLDTLDKFAEYLRSQEEVINVYSFSDVLKRLNQNMHGDQGEYYALPEDPELAAQYVLLYELSLPQGMDLNNTIALDKQSTRFTVTFGSSDSHGINDIRDRIATWQTENMPEYMRFEGTSYTNIWTDLGVSALSSSIQGALVSLFIISVVLVFVFRSFTYGLISLIPNLLPAAVGFGIWWLHKGELHFGMMMVLTVTIGIVVDDTVHFLSKYRRILAEEGKDSAQAIRETFAMVGPALITTTTVLVSGFAIMMASQFVANQDLGLMVCIVLMSALVLDFLLLPPLLMLFKLKN